MLKMRLRSTVFALGLAFVFAGPAAAQTVGDLSARVNKLENTLQAVYKALYDDGKISAETLQSLQRAPVGGGTAVQGNDAALARLTTRITDLEAQVRRMTGTFEETSHQISQISGRVDKLIADVDNRLTVLEQGAVTQTTQLQVNSPDQPVADLGAGETPATATAAPTASTPQPGVLGQLVVKSPEEIQKLVDAPTDATQTVVAAPQTTGDDGVLPAGTPEERYRFAFNLLRQQQFDRAEVALRQFTLTHPDHKLAGNAQYWLGETYYAREQFAEAVEVFKSGVQSYPDSPKTPDNLLKLGMSLANVGKAKEACITFGHLVSNYPGASAAVKRRANRERDLRKCDQL